MAPVRGLLLDLDGTLYEPSGPVPEAVEAVRELRAAGIALRFCTNIDSRTPETVSAEVAARGFEVAPGEVFTPVAAAERLLASVPGAIVEPLVSVAVGEALRPFVRRGAPTHVVVGDCRDTLDYAALDRAFRALRAGAELVALQRGRYRKEVDGDHVDAGAIIVGLEYAAGVKARTLGKPSADFFALAAASLGLDASEIAVVGDDATTDIEMALAVGARAIQVRTGKYADQAREGLESAEHEIIGSIADLPALLGIA